MVAIVLKMIRLVLFLRTLRVWRTKVQEVPQRTLVVLRKAVALLQKGPLLVATRISMIEFSTALAPRF